MASADPFKSLQDLVDQISRLPPSEGRVSEQQISAFNRFKSAVNQAFNNGCSSEVKAVFSSLEPKTPVLRMLVDMCRYRKIARSQVEGVWRKLLQVEDWMEAVNADAEISRDLELEELTKLKEAFFEAYDAWEDGGRQGTGGSEARVDEEALRAAFKEKENGKDHRLGGDEDPAAILEQIERGRQQIEALQFRVGDNVEFAEQAFDAFYRGVNQASHSKATDDDALDRIPMKEKILAFLVDLIAVKKKHKHRVAATVNRLLSIEGWKIVAAQADYSVTLFINELIAEPETHISPYAQEIAPPAQAMGMPYNGMPQGMRPAPASTNPFAPGGCMPGANSPVPAAMGVGPCANRTTFSVPSTNPFGGAAAPAPGGYAGPAGSPACAAPMAPTNPFSAGVAGRSAQPGSQPSQLPLPGVAHPTNPFGAAGGAPVPRVNSMEAVASPSMAGPGAKVPRAQSHEQYPLGGHSQANLAGFAAKTAVQHPQQTAAVAGAVAKSGHGPVLFNAAASATTGGNNPFDPHNKPRARTKR
mmetsp:Transcript_73020/g.136389  ORF Transcript_73020/g.136389 Transcript_73020/m.136389 type:complete len:529 (-) Transcript_73020:61-1647(-)